MCVCVDERERECVEIYHNTAFGTIHSFIRRFVQCFAHSQLVVAQMQCIVHSKCNPCIAIFYYALNDFVPCCCWWMVSVCILHFVNDVLPSIFHLKIPLHDHYSQHLFFYIFTQTNWPFPAQKVLVQENQQQKQQHQPLPQFIFSLFAYLSL